MAVDLQLLCEVLNREGAALGRIFEDWNQGTANRNDLQRALQKLLKLLVEKKTVLSREKQNLELRIGSNSKDFFRCINDTFIAYSEAFQAASSSSLHTGAGKLAGCYQKTCEARTLLIKAAGFLEGYGEYRKTNNLLLDLKKIIASERLASLLTYQTTESLLKQVGDFWSEYDHRNNSAYQKGMIVLRICEKRLRVLVDKTADAAIGDRLNRRLDDLYRLGERAEILMSGGVLTIFPEVTAVRNIAKKGFLKLAESLVDDLEYVFAPCRTFFREYDQNRLFAENGAPPISAEEVRAIVSKTGWEGAALELSKRNLGVQVDKLSILNYRIMANRKKLAAKDRPRRARQMTGQEE